MYGADGLFDHFLTFFSREAILCGEIVNRLQDVWCESHGSRCDDEIRVE